MKKSIIHIILLAVLALLIQGCGTLQTPPKQVKFYTLDYPPPQAAKKDLRRLVLLEIKPFSADEPYKTTRIVYAESKYSRSSYVYHRWFSEPAGMITDLIARDLKVSQIPEGVASPANPARPTHILNANIEDFYEDDTGAKWEAVLALSVTLTPAQTSSAELPVLLQKTYQVRKTMEQNNPQGLAMAMSEALEEVSERMLKDIRKILGE